MPDVITSVSSRYAYGAIEIVAGTLAFPAAHLCGQKLVNGIGYEIVHISAVRTLR